MDPVILSLVDKCSGAAKSASLSVSSLGDRMAAAGLQSDALTAATARLAKQQERAAVTSAAKSALGIKAPTKDVLGDAFGKAVSPTNALTGAVSSLGAALNPATIAMGALAIAVVAIVAVAGAAAAALYSIATAAISVAEQRGQLRATFDALGEGEGAGKRTLAMLDSLSARLPVTTGQLGEWAQKLNSAGVTSLPAVERGLTAVSSAFAIGGKDGQAMASAALALVDRLSMAASVGQAVKIDRRFLKGLAEAGVSASALSRELGTTPDKLAASGASAAKLGEAFQNALINKGAAPLEAIGLRWDTLKAKFSEGLGHLFDDLEPAIAPFMVEVKSLFDEFTAGQSTANATKGIVTGSLTEMFAVATSGLHTLHVDLLLLAAAGLDTYAAMQPALRAMAQFAMSDKGIALGKELLSEVAATAVVVGVVLGALGVACVALGSVMYTLFVAPIVALYDLGAAFVGALPKIGMFFSSIGEWAVDLAAKAIGLGVDFVKGIADGITNGASWVVDAIGSLGQKAVGAFKAFFKISSPSRLMSDQGLQIPAGAAQGIDRGSSMIAAASGRMSRKALPALGGETGGAAEPSGGMVRIVIEQGAIVINGASDVLTLTEEAVARIFERIAASRGLAVSRG